MKYRGFFLAMLSIVLILAVSSLASPFLIAFWQSSEEGITLPRVGIICALMVVAQIINVLLVRVRESFAKEFNKRNFKRYIEQLLRMDYDTLSEKGVTKVVDRIQMAVNSIYFYMTGDHISIWSSAVLIVASLVFVASISWPIALVLLAMLPINYFGYKLLNTELARRSMVLSQNTSSGLQSILSSLQQVDYLKQSGEHGHLLKTLDGPAEKIYGSMASVNIYAQSMSRALMGLNTITQNVTMIYLVYVFMASALSPYSLMLYTMVLPLYFSSLTDIVGANINKNDYHVAMSLRKELEDAREPDGVAAVGVIESIGLNVTELQIPGRRIPFLAKAQLHKGDIAKVCGGSGSGKSTFIKALLKFRPSDGIEINGIPLSQVRNADLRQRMEYLSQNVPIIKGSLRDNLFFNLEHSQSAERELLGEEILSSILSGKTMDTEIHEGGANLSGGEKQKIAVARALAKNVDVLILDEICSNIDSESARLIYEQIAAKRGEHITLIITHDSLPEGFANVELNSVS